MKRTITFLWLALFAIWMGMKFGSKLQFREKFHFHHCQLEWRGPFGALHEYHLVCPETGTVLGEVYERESGDWNAFSIQCFITLNREFLTPEQAKQAVEKCQ